MERQAWQRLESGGQDFRAGFLAVSMLLKADSGPLGGASVGVATKELWGWVAQSARFQAKLFPSLRFADKL